MEVKVSREAARELEEAAAWYEKEESGLGERLIDAFEHATQLLKEPNPPVTPVTGEAAGMGAKKLILHRFPFSLIAVQNQQTITVVAFAHHARKPGYWRKRLTP
ncbi:type II toxin-antitoxin system RelE/ParE family toxin [Thioalkalivibrio sulfidiphilus]|uniref:type II toxin-antitoxin system RelE/ParE family toxin n=1 Tax=Thioalkalivibrio sulfidiphilus TaxID=1033854 RepID=UPI0018CAE0A6|nr:type II toxin-antitoxin system RelE/ParE family toxin [Thioalkalivibrio sulfidiphilus]